MSWAVVPAAGSSRRFGGDVPKQYRDIGGKPVLRWSLEKLAAAGVDGIVVVLAADDHRWPDWREVDGVKIVTAIGGAERVDSVLSGLRALPPWVADDTPILVHDAARPCVRVADIERLLRAGAGLLAVPMRDTVKQRLEDRVATLPREALWRAQTPQCFARGVLTVALASARAGGRTPTDEAQAMEWLGHPIALIEGSEDNLKITTEQDLRLAHWLLIEAP
jgi:2-C-methyl-D-erythritol 4-phosphate cytidylyltransferase